MNKRSDKQTKKIKSYYGSYYTLIDGVHNGFSHISSMYRQLSVSMLLYSINNMLFDDTATYVKILILTREFKLKKGFCLKIIYVNTCCSFLFWSPIIKFK